MITLILMCDNVCLKRLNMTYKCSMLNSLLQKWKFCNSFLVFLYFTFFLHFPSPWLLFFPTFTSLFCFLFFPLFVLLAILYFIYYSVYLSIPFIFSIYILLYFFFISSFFFLMIALQMIYLRQWPHSPQIPAQSAWQIDISRACLSFPAVVSLFERSNWHLSCAIGLNALARRYFAKYLHA